MGQYGSFRGFIDSVLQVRLASALVEQGFNPTCNFLNYLAQIFWHYLAPQDSTLLPWV